MPLKYLVSIKINRKYNYLLQLEGKCGVKVIGVDRDPEAVENINLLKKNNTEIRNRLTVFHARFSRLSEIEIRPFTKAQGIMFDLGYSTAQVLTVVNEIFTIF